MSFLTGTTFAGNSHNCDNNLYSDCHLMDQRCSKPESVVIGMCRSLHDREGFSRVRLEMQIISNTVAS